MQRVVSEWRASRANEVTMFIDAAGMMADDLADEMRGTAQTIYRVPSFDRLAPIRRLHLLGNVLATICDRATDVIHSESEMATVDAVLSHVNEMVRQEIEAELNDDFILDDDPYSWRRVVWAAVPKPRANTWNNIDVDTWMKSLRAIRMRIVGTRQGGDSRTPTCLCTAGDSSSPGATTSEAEIEQLWKRLRSLTHEFERD